MTARRPCPPAPGPLEDYATQFDPLLASVAQRRGLRDYLQGLLLPRDRNKTLTALADAEPITGAQHREVQRLQWFCRSRPGTTRPSTGSGSSCCRPTRPPRPTGIGVLVIDDAGDRKDGSATAHVARQYLGSVGKTDNGIVAVTSLWADARCYWPLHAVPYTPVSRLAKGKSDPGFGPSRSWPPSWSSPPKRPRSGSGRWWPTASTATTPALWRRWVAPGWGSCWRSSPARVSGRPMMRRTRR
jgi:SRSO17 transposase